MGIALPSLSILILLLPGIVFRRFYYTEEFSKQYFKSSFGDLLTSTLIPAIFIHLVLLLFVYLWTSVNFEVLGVFISGTDDVNKLDYAFQNLSENKIKIIFYFISCSALGGLAGIYFKYYIRTKKLDRKHKIFRYQNEWHYLFSGEILDFPRVDGKYEDVDFRYVDALVDTSEGLIIYQGVLEDYVLSKNGGIDRIYMSDVKRRMLVDDSKDNNDESKYYEMPGEFFVIPYDRIINLHIIYYKIELNSDIKEAIE